MGEINSNTVLIYILIFKVGLSNALLKLLVLLKNILRDKNLAMCPHMYVMEISFWEEISSGVLNINNENP